MEVYVWPLNPRELSLKLCVCVSEYVYKEEGLV